MNWSFELQFANSTLCAFNLIVHPPSARKVNLFWSEKVSLLAFIHLTYERLLTRTYVSTPAM